MCIQEYIYATAYLCDAFESAGTFPKASSLHEPKCVCISASPCVCVCVCVCVCPSVCVVVYSHLHLGRLADAFVQSDLQ